MTMSVRFGAYIPLWGKDHAVRKVTELITTKNGQKGVPTDSEYRGAKDNNPADSLIVTGDEDVTVFRHKKKVYKEGYSLGKPDPDSLVQREGRWQEYRKTLPSTEAQEGALNASNVLSKIQEGTFNPVTGEFTGDLVSSKHLILRNTGIPGKGLDTLHEAMVSAAKTPPRKMKKGIILFGPKNNYTPDELRQVATFAQSPDLSSVVALAKLGPESQRWALVSNTLALLVEKPIVFCNGLSDLAWLRPGHPK